MGDDDDDDGGDGDDDGADYHAVGLQLNLPAEEGIGAAEKNRLHRGMVSKRCHDGDDGVLEVVLVTMVMVTMVA